ncbi:MAG: ATP-binding protein [Thermoanaerobaculia bacterium]|nr:ATP-binding protein [Thermoanaerobaculia bacterium]
MDLRERLLSRRKDSRWIFGGLAGLLLVLSAIYYLIGRGRQLPADLVTNRLLLLAIWYVNLVLIIVIAFVLLRNLFKLLVERHYKILGSKLRTKLVMTFIGLSLLPVLLLFFYGSRLLEGWIDRWFDEPAIERVAANGHAVTQELNRRIEADNLREARKVLEEIRELDLTDPQKRPRLARRLQRLLNELELDYLAVYNGLEFVHAVLRPQSGLREPPRPLDRHLRAALIEGQTAWSQTPAEGGGRLFLTGVSDRPPPGQPGPIVIAGATQPADLARASEQLVAAYQGYRQLEVQKDDIETTYRLTFLMVTLLILLMTSWVGNYLARRVTVPIEALAAATRRLSEGDLSYRVDVPADDELSVLVASFNQMTADLKRNEEALVAANRRLAEERSLIAAVLENVAAGVISVDEEGRILTCNRAALKMLGQREARVAGRAAGEVWRDPERRKLMALLEEDPGPSGRLTRSLRLLIGLEWKNFEAKVRTMRDDEGRLSGRVMVIEDLTELIKAQRMAAWNEAARRIAHEIKNPLTPIRLSAERLLMKYRQRDPELGRALEEGVALIGREVEAMKSMVDDFSRFARMRPPQPSQTDVSQLIAETVKLYQGLKSGVEVRSVIAPDARTALVDREQIKRVLINLLDNALEATPAPGEVSISASSANGNLRIEVADTGDGIPADAREKLFLPYFSTKGRGSGLGLSIVDRIVSEHHGTVRVEPNEPRGTVFRIELPRG